MLISQLLTSRGITLKKFYPHSNSEPISYLEIDFEAKGCWFDKEEIELLKEYNYLSAMGYIFEQDAYKYNACCCGSNDLFSSEEDLIVFLKMQRVHQAPNYDDLPKYFRGGNQANQFSTKPS